MSDECVEIASKSDHCVEMLDLFNQQRERGELCDVAIVTEGGKLNAHRLVLSLGSPIFRTMFSSTRKKANSAEVNFSDINCDTMERIIEFIYTTQLKISTETAENVIIAANFLQMTDLVDLCGSYLGKNIDATNCFSFRELMITTNCDQKIVARANDYINSDFLQIAQNESFLQLGIDDVVKLLNTEVCCKSEEDVFYAAVRWLEARDEPEKYSQRIIRCICLSHLSKSFKQFHITNNSLFKKTKQINVTKKARTPKTTLLAVRRLNEESSLHTYDSSSKNWILMMELENKNYTNIAASKDYIFLCNEDTDLQTRFFEAYNRETKEWIKLLPTMTDEGPVDMLTIGNKLYVLRHFIGRAELTKITVFDMDSKNKRGKLLKNVDEELGGTDIFVLDKYIYSLGAWSNDNLKLNTETNKWSYLDSNMFEGTYNPSAIYKGKIYRRSDDEEVESVVVYDESKKEWEKLAQIPEDVTKYISTTDGIYGFYEPAEWEEETDSKNIFQFYDVARNVWISRGKLPAGFEKRIITAIPE